MSDEYTIGSDDKIARLEKRGRGFRRLITAINDLPLYGIIHATHPTLVNELELFKDKLKNLISENNNDLAQHYTNESLHSDPFKDEINNQYAKKGT